MNFTYVLLLYLDIWLDNLRFTCFTSGWSWPGLLEKSGTPCASSNHLGVQVIQSQKAWANLEMQTSVYICMGLLATTCASQWHAECQGLSKQIPLDHPVTHPPVTQLIWWFSSPKQFTFKVGSLSAPWPTTACQGWMNCGSCSLAKQSKKCQLSRIYDQRPCLTYWWWVCHWCVMICFPSHPSLTKSSLKPLDPSELSDLVGLQLRSPLVASNAG